jgi:hypothetical protein
MEKVMFDFRRLRGRIIERFGSCAAFGEAAGFKRGSISARLNNQTPWKDTEIFTACRLLDIPGAEIDLYFFTPMFD